MALAESLFSKLSDAAGATAALVGSGNACRVYPEIAPQGVASPYVVWQEIASVPDTTHDGASTSARRIVNIYCIAGTYAGALALSTAIVAALDSVALAGGELCVSCGVQNGFSEATDQFLRIVEAEFFAAPG